MWSLAHGFQTDTHSVHLVTEVWDLNPNIRAKDVEYCLIFSVYNSLEQPLQDKEPAVRSWWSNSGHYTYSNYGKMTKDGCIKARNHEFGMTPFKRGSPWGDGKIADQEESDNFEMSLIYEQSTGIQIRTEAAVPIRYEDLKTIANFSAYMQQNPPRYLAHFGQYHSGYSDCIKFTNSVLKEIGIDAKITDIIKPMEIKGFPMAKWSAMLNDVSEKTALGLSAKDVAKEYNVPVDRVETIHHSQPHDPAAPFSTFRIMSYEKYFKKITGK